MNLFQMIEFLRFYRAAVTKYQLHSTFVYELSVAMLEDSRGYYAFSDIEALREKMLSSEVMVNFTDFGTGSGGQFRQKTEETASQSTLRSVRSIARQSGSSARQGQMLFRLVNFLQPQRMLELGTSVGIGAMYLAAAARESQMISLEGSDEIAHVARTHLDFMGLSKKVEVREGAFEQTLLPALQNLKSLDLIFLDGNHRKTPTLHYFETCLPFAHAKTVFVFDDIYGSTEMTEAWEQIKNHSSVTLTLDFFELSLAFIDPDFREKQHFKIVPARWKPWMFF